MHDFVIEMIAEAGYAGLFFLMFAENVFPPIPSEIILPLTGFLIAEGVLNPAAALAASTAGALLGALPWFYIGRYLSGARRARLVARYGVYFSVSSEDIERSAAFFARHQWSAVFFGRFIPIIRTLISLPAGSVRMPLGIFLLLTMLGTALWNTALFSLGFLLQAEYTLVERYLDPIGTFIIALILATYLYRILKHIVSTREVH